jgi:hypothetical protein
LNVNALTWLAVQIGNEPSTTDDYLFVQWGERAAALGWTAQDLFGLHDPPEQRGQNYRRLSRNDVIGLIWLLHGRPVVALTADRAVIGTAGGRSNLLPYGNSKSLKGMLSRLSLAGLTASRISWRGSLRSLRAA